MTARLLRCLLLAWVLAAACTSSSDVPACPSGAVVDPDPDAGTAMCGTCTVVHGEGECPPEYVCTSCLECVWFANGFPLDAGLGLCRSDAGPGDLAFTDQR